MKKPVPFSTVVDITNQMIVDAARQRSNSKHCDCCVAFIREKDNKCNICERVIENI